MRAGSIALTILTVASAAGATPPKHERSALQRDVEGYAAAACLVRQREPLLKEQGGAWASAIVQRSHGDIDPFNDVAKAVNAELRRSPVAIGRDDATGKDRSMPVLRCGEIVDTPSVRAAIDRAEARLAPNYRQHNARSRGGYQPTVGSLSAYLGQVLTKANGMFSSWQGWLVGRISGRLLCSSFAEAKTPLRYLNTPWPLLKKSVIRSSFDIGLEQYVRGRATG